ncbi:class E basic helix-loop-helix protein 41 [Microcaecilia unicolor]|uniref:Class E basic helix-loop-helix protein 41 n=1 Tax=Microcaecilia unicolor TaxID=1415580 RepID=A0A6P7Z649_9AMPH|nr:class E basic helix-loop-helix protein 41 [Microcaecilia unicolor]
MDEGIPRLQERQLLEHRDFIGVDYPSLYICKPKRGMKRDESKETYKLPHRLIEKKRRDRINECIAQLKDLLPEHLKLTTLGHLEKAVVLELTLKHLKALTALTEQQHQKIIALQNGERSLKSPIQSDLDAFHSGFQSCAKEVLQYLSRYESWTPREQRCAQLINHLHSLSGQLLTGPPLLTQQVSEGKKSMQDHSSHKTEHQAYCVPVIQRIQNVELNENDTDTDSGYGGESEKQEGKAEGASSLNKSQAARNIAIKKEPIEELPPKRFKRENSGSMEPALRADAALFSSLMAFGGAPFSQQAPLCLPFYFISPSAATSYLPFLDKHSLEKYLYPAAAAAAAGPIPLLYPGIPSAAATAAIPCLSSALTPATLQHEVMSPSPCAFPGATGPLAEELDSPRQDRLQSAKENA